MLGGVALLKKVWSCWKKPVTGEADFEVSNILKTLPSVLHHFLLLSDEDIVSTRST